jgi:hypothetical protein
VPKPNDPSKLSTLIPKPQQLPQTLMQVPKTKDYHKLLKIAKSKKKQVATLESSLSKIHDMFYIKDDNFVNEVDELTSQYTLDTLGRMTLQFVPQDSPRKIGPEQQKRIKLKRKMKWKKK